MSERAPLSELPLFAPPVESAAVQAVHDRAEDTHAEFLDRVRRILAGMYASGGYVISTDEAWAAMERYGIRIPEGCSPNVLGSLFSGWERATPVGWTRSKRPGANANLLRTWEIG